MSSNATDVREALRAVLKADMEERVAYHAPYGYNSQEQWQYDTEKEMARAIANDEQLLDKLVAAVLDTQNDGSQGGAA